MNTEIVLATNNKHKLAEFRAILSPLGYVVYCPNDLNIQVEVDETGTTYFENSYLKAKAIAKLVPFPVIADDSGFEVVNLNRFPGIYSSRFAQQFNNDYFLAGTELNKRLADKSKEAEFHCVICYLAKEDAKPLYFEGICKGTLLETPAGKNGFGYDPFFFSTDLNKNFGTAYEKEKNKVSHRGRAIKKLVTFLSIK